MSLQPINNGPRTPGVKSAAKSFSSVITTVIILLLIAIAVMGIMTGKKFLEAQQTTPENQEIGEYTEYVNKYPEDIDARLGLAFAYQQAERYDEAREQYLEVLNIEPYNQGAMFNIGEIARINKDYQEAEARLKALMGKYEYHTLGAISLAQVYIDTQKYDDAIKIMDKMIAGSKEMVDFHLIKGDALAKKGEKDKAKVSYNEVLKYDPDNQAAKKALAALK